MNLPRVFRFYFKIPKVDGLEALRRLKANPHSGDTSVVTRHSSPEKRELVESHRHGASSCLGKAMGLDPSVDCVCAPEDDRLLLNQVPEQ